MAKARFAIMVEPLAFAEMKLLRAFERTRIAEEIDTQLPFQPNVTSKRRKLLGDLKSSFHFEPPLWELKVGSFRVFYDVDVANRRVKIRAVRYKGPTGTTEKVIS